MAGSASKIFSTDSKLRPDGHEPRYAEPAPGADAPKCRAALADTLGILKLTALETLRTYRLFKRPDEFATSGQIILWWERRRIPYNLIVGFVGAVSIGMLVGLAILKGPAMPNTDSDLGNPFFGVITTILYGIMANVCYTAGWVSELIVYQVWPKEKGRYGEIVFILGLGFSIALTLLPFLVLLPLSLLSHS